jgi:hypothetical protein
MADPENPNQSRSPEDEKKLVEGFCEELKRVLELFADADKQNPIAPDRTQALEAAATLIHHSLHDNLDIRFLVIIPEGVRAELSENREVSQENVRQFEATEIHFIGYSKDGFQIDFHDAKEDETRNHWLSVYSYDIDVTPIHPSTM